MFSRELSGWQIFLTAISLSSSHQITTAQSVQYAAASPTTMMMTVTGTPTLMNNSVAATLVQPLMFRMMLTVICFLTVQTLTTTTTDCLILKIHSLSILPMAVIHLQD